MTKRLSERYGTNRRSFNYNHSFFMLKDKTSDPETGEKSVMCAKYFMAEMQKYD